MARDPLARLVRSPARGRLTLLGAITLDAWGHIATALRALEKHWHRLNPEQQWSARDHLRSFAKRLPKIDPIDLTKSGDW